MLRQRQMVSLMDKSVNFILRHPSAPKTPDGSGGFLETRYVRRTQEKVSVYVSSHTGCRMGCRQCHLTATGQTSFTPTTPEQFGEQLEVPLGHYGRQIPFEGVARRLNVNFMARGEPLANPHVMRRFQEVLSALRAAAAPYDLPLRLNLSTIYPHVADRFVRASPGAGGLAGILGGAAAPVHLYYSLYSADPAFRARWLPGAAPAQHALEALRRFEEDRVVAVPGLAAPPVTFHWAIIEGENDSLEQAEEVARLLRPFAFQAGRFNVVRFNPPPPVPVASATSTGRGEEAARVYREASDERLGEVLRIVAAAVGDPKRERSRVIPRVGYDVSASCGMFVGPKW